MNKHFDCPDAQAFLRLLHVPGTLLAVRSLKPQQEWHCTPAALHDALDLLERHSGTRALYACVNPVHTDINSGYAQDEDITALRWFPLDADPVRPTDTASTEDEKAEADALMTDLLDALRAHLPDLDASLVLCDSGNGAHALIRLPDYPPHATGKERSPQWHTLKRLHTVLCKHFSTPQVKLDTAVMNPSRIWRIPGTRNVKGANTPERPHRMARLLTPEDFTPVPLDLLAHAESLIAALGLPMPAPPDPSVSGGPCERGTSEQGGGSLPPWWNETIKSGGRNDAAYQRARWLLNATEGTRESKDAWAELAAWNRVCCRPPLDTAELRKTFDSATNAGDNPAYMTPPSPPELGAGGSVPWPTPLAPEAFHGLAGEIVRAIEPHTEADPAAVLVQLLVAVGSAIGRSPFFGVGATRHHTNLFAVIVGDTAHARKGTSWDECRAILRDADPDWMPRVTGGLTSGEGLIQAVRDRVEKEVPKKDKEGKRMGTETETVVTDEGVSDKRLLAVESEYASVLQAMQRDGNTLSATIRNAWDTGTLSNMTKEGRRATGAHISIIGHITSEELRRSLTNTEACNGFANRYLWTCARRSKLLPEPTRPDPAVMKDLSWRLLQAIGAARQTGEVKRDEDARRQWAAVYADLTAATPGMLGSVTARAAPIVARLSLLYALLDQENIIRAPHLLAALALWEYTEASCRFIFGDSLGDPLADDILRRLRAAGTQGLSRSEISHAFSRHKDTRRLDQALALLAEHKRIRCETHQTGGRPEERYHAL